MHYDPYHKSLELLTPYYQLERPIDWDRQFRCRAPLEVEIGFGTGEMLIQKALDYLECNYIGIEQNWGRIYKALKKIRQIYESSDDDQCLKNIKILDVDAFVAFERLFFEKSIDNIYSLYPCPWPGQGIPPPMPRPPPHLKSCETAQGPPGSVLLDMPISG